MLLQGYWWIWRQTYCCSPLVGDSKGGNINVREYPRNAAKWDGAWYCASSPISSTLRLEEGQSRHSNKACRFGYEIVASPCDRNLPYELGTPLSLLSAQISGETPFALSPLVCCAIANTLMKMASAKQVYRMKNCNADTRISLSIPQTCWISGKNDANDCGTEY